MHKTNTSSDLPLSESLQQTSVSPSSQVSVSDDEGRIVYASPGFYDALGYSAEELLGQNYAILNSEAHNKEFIRDIMKSLARGTEWRGNIALRRKDGVDVWMELTFFQLPRTASTKARFVAISTHSRRAMEMESLLTQFLEGDPVATFVIDSRHIVTHWNRAMERVTGVLASEVVGTNKPGLVLYGKERRVLADLIVDGDLESLDSLYAGKFRHSPVIPDAYEVDGFFPDYAPDGRWLTFTAAPLRDVNGKIIGAIETVLDVTERKRAEQSLRQSQLELELLVERRTEQLARAKAELEEDIAKRQAYESQLKERNAELTELNRRLSQAQEQLVQSEKLASLGQLAAGVAHEINNPIGYVQSNLSSLKNYVDDFMGLLQSFEQAVMALPEDHPERVQALNLKAQKDLDYLREDVPALISESGEGVARVRQIVADLKDFSRLDNSQDWQFADLHQGIESTLNIVSNEMKYKADVIKEFAQLPEIECMPSRLNQVFMNLLVNAAHAMTSGRGKIWIRTGMDGADKVWVEVIDNGCGIKPENIRKIFDPFYTTKPVGQGTGLGLSLSYSIVQKHGGDIKVVSLPRAGSTFRVVLPVRQPQKVELP
jgi:two-component system, NtrC family, sensor kinase